MAITDSAVRTMSTRQLAAARCSSKHDIDTSAVSRAVPASERRAKNENVHRIMAMNASADGRREVYSVTSPPLRRENAAISQ